MMLYINGEDIASLTLGLVQKRGERFVFVETPKTESASPEEYLERIQSFLLSHKLEVKDLSGLLVASGEGSGTALRGTHAIANVFAFAQSLPLYAVRKTRIASDEDALRAVDQVPHTFLRPAYEKAPHITKSDKDALRR